MQTVLLLLQVQKDSKRILQNPQPPSKKWNSCQSGRENDKLPVNISIILERREAVPHCRYSQWRKGQEYDGVSQNEVSKETDSEQKRKNIIK